MGSFLPGHHLEHNPKKHRVEHFSGLPPIIHSISSEEMRGGYGGLKPIMTSTACHAYSSSLNHMQDIKNSAPQNKSYVPDEECKGLSHTNCEVSC